MHKQNSFVTLTYSDPAPPQLVKEDLQLFFKRLRAEGLKFRYFAAGEYGSKTKRPHYHVLFFGQDFRDGSYSLGMGDKSDNGYYGQPALSNTWGLGHVTIARCEPASVFYVAGYALKSLDDPDAFQIMSRRPAIGASWCEAYHNEAIANGFVTIDGRKHPVPKAYFRRKPHEFATLVDRQRLHAARSMDGRQPTLTARDREVFLRSQASLARGSL